MTAMWVLGAFALLLDCALIWAALALAAQSDERGGWR